MINYRNGQSQSCPPSWTSRLPNLGFQKKCSRIITGGFLYAARLGNFLSG
jgi:hypothetical protein